jgi:hypothetical protein
MSELDDLLGQVQRLGVPGHAHNPGSGREEMESCADTEICISEEEPFSALVKAPARTAEVHVDTMTAYGLLCDLPDGSGFDVVWKELVDVDRGP